MEINHGYGFVIKVATTHNVCSYLNDQCDSGLNSLTRELKHATLQKQQQQKLSGKGRS